MDRVEEELACMNTLVAAVARGASLSFVKRPPTPAVAAHGDDGDAAVELLGMDEACEYIDLMSQLLSSDNNEFRITSMLEDTKPSLLKTLVRILTTDPAQVAAAHDAAHEGETVSEFQHLQLVALRAVAGAMGLAAQSPRLVKVMKAQLVATGFIDTAVRYTAMEDPRFLQPALECVHTCAAKLDIGDEVIRCDGVEVLSSVALCLDNPPLAQRFAVSTLRTLAAVASEKFMDIELLKPLVRLVHTGTHDGISVHVFELLTDVVVDNASFWVRRGSALMASTLIDAVLTVVRPDVSSASLDALEAACVFVRTCAVAEATEASGVEQGFIAQLITSNAVLDFVRVMSDASDAAARAARMGVFATVVQYCVVPPLLTKIVDMLGSDSQSLSGLLSAPQRLPPFHDGTPHANAFAHQGTTAIATLLAKHPKFRLTVKRATVDFPGWLGGLQSQLLREMEAVFASAAGAAVSEAPMVDAAGNIINSVCYVDAAAPHAWATTHAMESLFAAFFEKQLVTLGRLAPRHYVPPSTGASTAMPAPPPHKKAIVLTLGVMTYAVLETFRADPEPAVFTDTRESNAFATDDTEPIDRWEAEEDAPREPAPARPHMDDSGWPHGAPRDNPYAIHAQRMRQERSERVASSAGPTESRSSSIVSRAPSHPPEPKSVSRAKSPAFIRRGARGEFRAADLAQRPTSGRGSSKPQWR